MLVTKTKAAELAGVSRRTFYNHIPEKRISITTDSDGSEKIDIAELERVYGLEVVRLNLKKLEDAQVGVSNDVQSSHNYTQQSVQYELLIAEEKLASAQLLIDQLKGEREHLIADKETLQEHLNRALEIGVPIGKLLTDQSENARNLAAIEKNNIEIAFMNEQAEKKLRQYARRHQKDRQTIQALQRKLKEKEAELNKLHAQPVWKKLFAS